MTEKYKKKYTVGWGDMDINYRLTKIAATKYFQETFALYCAKKNLAAFDIINNNLVWVISDLRINFEDEMPYWSEFFEVEIWISEKTALKTFCDFKIYKKEKLIAKGSSCWYLLDVNSRRPVKSNEILNDFEIFEEKIFDNKEKLSFKPQGNKISEKEHEVTVRDLDFNYHVNNLSYINLALETLPPEIVEKYTAEFYAVKFVKEAYLNDILICEIYEEEKNFFARIFNKKNNTDVCLIFLKCNNKTDFSRNPREKGISFE